MKVYVRWYGKVLEGEMLDGESMGMKQVRIPLDGHHPIALFAADHVYETADHPDLILFEPRSVKKEIFEIKISTPADIMPADDRQLLEAFKRDNWDHERNHLRIDKLDEFYQLWRMVMTPFGFAEATVTLPSHKPTSESGQSVLPKRTQRKQKQTNKHVELSLFD